MNKLALVLFSALLTSQAMADNQQTVWINGQATNKTVKEITFDGDNLVLTYTDESTQTEDMALVKLMFFDGESTGISSAEAMLPASQQEKIYNLNGQLMGSSTHQLKKGIYIVKGKKVIVR